MSRGVRFAPSPTGTFHIGNLRTAWISHELARALGEPWIVRFEDIDRPRVKDGAQESQLADLAALGLVPDEVHVQSRSADRHWEVFEQVRQLGQAYPCFCSRKQVQDALAAAASAPHPSTAAPSPQETAVYDGHCRNLAATPGPALQHPTLAWRLKLKSPTDGTQDFIIARTGPLAGGRPDRGSFVPAYHWACAVDDYDGNYRLIVRAWDLAPALAQQRAIHSLCSELFADTRSPEVYHTTLIVADDGHRLEKRTLGVTLGELLNSGWSVDDLLERFRASAKIRSRLDSPASGEHREVLGLTELLGR